MTARPFDAASYSPAAADSRRYLNAIARRNTAWAHMREAEELLRMAERIPTADLRPYRSNSNTCQGEYEHALTDLIRERVRYREGLRLAQWAPAVTQRRRLPFPR
jgi:hypothetical protein